LFGWHQTSESSDEFERSVQQVEFLPVVSAPMFGTSRRDGIASGGRETFLINREILHG
jgi:hypothetical protein